MSAGDAQARVQAAIDHPVASGDEAGVQVVVVDAGSGSTDGPSASAPELDERNDDARARDRAG